MSTVERVKINDVPCRVCGAEPGEPCVRLGGRAPIHGWHGSRVDDAAHTLLGLSSEIA